jgi:hypothetical protein
LFAKTPFTTMRALMEFKVTTAEKETTAEVANQKNFDAKKKLVSEVAELVKTRQAEGTGGPLKQKEAKELVQKFKEKLGLEVPVKPVLVHLINVPGDGGKMITRTFYSTEKNADAVRLSLATFDMKGNRLRWDETTKEVVTIPVTAPSAEVIAYLTANATPPEPTKEEKKAAAEAAKAAKKGAKKGAAKDEQDDDEDDVPAVKVKGKNKPAPADEEEGEEGLDETEIETSSEEEEDETPAPKKKAAVVEDEDEDDAPVAKKKAAIIEDEDD